VNRPDFSIVSVNYKVADLLRLLVESVPGAAGDRSFEIVVVDNASSDGVVEMLRDGYPHVRVIESGSNLGFAGGNNLGVSHAKGRYIALVNPDVVLSPRSLEALARFLDEHPRAGMIGPKIVLPDGSTQSFAGALPSSWDVVDALPAGRLIARTLRHRASAVNGSDRAVRCGIIHGSCMVFTREAFERIGGMPRDTFMYGEELLLGHRLQQAGFEVWYVPSVHVVHREESSANLRFEPHEKALRKRWAHAVARAQILPFPSFIAWNAILASRALAAGLRAKLTANGASSRHFDFARLHLRGLGAPRVSTGAPISAAPGVVDC
jgi:GT2 family glycosyltransferase